MRSPDQAVPARGAPDSQAHSAGGGVVHWAGGDWELPMSPRGTEESQRFAELVQVGRQRISGEVGA
jgi:hypothetical protein